MKIQTHSGLSHPAYRPDIDGLRAFAVVAVVCFHAFGVRGGFAGVDFFFVISGYLITSILLRSLAQNEFSIARFYERRIRRIFPALTVVLLATLAAAWCLLWSDELQQLGKHVAAGAGFVANLMYWSEAGYFDRASEAKPLLHLWSLGIEEQFYIVWPVLLWLAARMGWALRWVTALLLMASFCWNLVQVVHDPVAAFYSPLGRAWELLAGALLAGYGDRVAVATRARRDWLAWAGLLCLVIGLISLDRQRMFPGAWALLPVMGAVLVIAAGADAGVNRRFWSHPVMVWVGGISYSLYLWHWPLLALAFAVEGDTPTPAYRVGAVTASVMLAWISLRWVETPLRSPSPSTATPWVLVLLLGLTGLLGYGAFRSDGFPQRAAQHDPKREFLKHYRVLHEKGLAQAYRAECDFYDWSTKLRKSTLPISCTEAGKQGTWLLWGDSHAQALSLGLRNILPLGYHLAQVATSACKPSPDPTQETGLAESCGASNRYAMAAVHRLKPAVVILAQSDSHQQRDWAAFAAILLRAGAQRVLLVGPTPQWKPSLPLVITRYHWNQDMQRTATGLDPKILATERHLRELYERSKAPGYVSLIDALCTSDGCLAYVPEDPQRSLLLVDSGHLTPSASLYVARQVLAPALVPH